MLSSLQWPLPATTRLGSARSCVAPRPPREPVAVRYGHEDGLLKATDPARLLDPPVVLTDELFHLRDKTRADTIAHIEAENAYTAAAQRRSQGWRRQQAKLLERLTAPAPPAPELWHGSGTAGTGGVTHTRGPATAEGGGNRDLAAG